MQPPTKVTLLISILFLQAHKCVAQNQTNAFILPTITDLWEYAQVVLEPLKLGSSLANAICSAIIATNIEQTIIPDINILQFQLRTACNRTNFTLLEADEMLNSPDFDPSKKVVLLVTGWNTNINGMGIDIFSKAFACRGDVNFLAFDAAEYINTFYIRSALNTKELGRLIAVGLEKLTSIVPTENIHLIGHSLGAHIVGAAGRFFYNLTGELLPRITGLDPANPCFNEGEFLSGILRGDAEFIDIIHSNPGVSGVRDPVGDADFYPEGYTILKPGCITIDCSHMRSIDYFVETIYPGNELNFPAKRCSSLTRYREGRCLGEDEPMGYTTPTTLIGNYFLEVNAEPPYGKAGDKQRIDDQKYCGECEESNGR